MRHTEPMADTHYEDQDPRATIPIVSGSNFAQYAIGLPTRDPVVTRPKAPSRSRRRAIATVGWILLVLLVGAAAAWIAYGLTRSH